MKRKFAFKFSNVVLYIFILISTLSFAALASENFSVTDVPVGDVSEYGYIQFDMPDSSNNVKIENERNFFSILKSNNLPSSFDSRVNGKVTSVKNQGSYNSCWAFATLAASESSILTEYPEKYSSDTLDLSELHLAYFTYSTVSDKLGLTSEEGLSKRVTSINPLNVGGNMYAASMNLLRHFGAADEAAYPYDSYKSGYTTANENAYSTNTQSLKNAYWVPISDTDKIKEMIMEYSAGAISYYSRTAYLNSQTGGYINRYSADVGKQNHAVTVVGWDDNYSLDNFGGSSGTSKKPSNNGAWLVKNSWGTDSALDGYIWISYEDQTLGDAAFFFEYYEAEPYDNVYQYDMCSTIATLNNNSGSITYANIFPAQEQENLQSVSFVSNNQNADFTVQIYKNLTDNSSPVNGDAVFADAPQYHEDCPGCYTVTLPEAVPLEKGEIFSVVVTCQASGTVYAIMDSAQNISTDMRAKVAAKEGQSFYLKGDAWTDLQSVADTNGLNFRIKAFTDNALSPNEKLNIIGVPENVLVQNSFTLSGEISPENVNVELNWSSTDETVATVDSSGKVTPLKAGKTTIICRDMINGKSAEIEIDVNPAPCTDITINGLSQAKTVGTDFELSVSVSPSYADSEVIWSTSNSEIASVDANGKLLLLKSGIVTVTCKAVVGETEKSVTLFVQPQAPCELAFLSTNSDGFTWKKVDDSDGYIICKIQPDKKDIVIGNTQDNFCVISPEYFSSDNSYYVMAYKKTEIGLIFSEKSDSITFTQPQLLLSVGSIGNDALGFVDDSQLFNDEIETNLFLILVKFIEKIGDLFAFAMN